LKKVFTYIHYFLNLGINWNFKLALFIIYHEIRGEKKFGLSTIGIDDLTSSVAEDDRKHASIYQPINFFIAEWLFEKAQLLVHNKESTRFLDAGCGKGRALLMAAFYGYQNISGFDISLAMCHEAILNTEKANVNYPDASFCIEQANANSYKIPDDTGVIFLFNPFDIEIMQGFIEQVLRSLQKAPREILVLYANPECKQAWMDAGFMPIGEIRKMNWLHGMVLSNKKAGN
jgi:SAM-dependent methyltransferase